MSLPESTACRTRWWHRKQGTPWAVEWAAEQLVSGKVKAPLLWKNSINSCLLLRAHGVQICGCAECVSSLSCSSHYQESCRNTALHVSNSKPPPQPSFLSASLDRSGLAFPLGLRSSIHFYFHCWEKLELALQTLHRLLQGQLLLLQIWASGRPWSECSKIWISGAQRMDLPSNCLLLLWGWWCLTEKQSGQLSALLSHCFSASG